MRQAISLAFAPQACRPLSGPGGVVRFARAFSLRFRKLARSAWASRSCRASGLPAPSEFGFPVPSLSTSILVSPPAGWAFYPNVPATVRVGAILASQGPLWQFARRAGVEPFLDSLGIGPHRADPPGQNTILEVHAVPRRAERRRSSVVERVIGNDEVDSSILSGGTMVLPQFSASRRLPSRRGLPTHLVQRAGFRRIESRHTP